MFFAENEITLELLGVFKLKREKLSLKSVSDRSYDSISLRISGRGHFKTASEDITVKKGELLYIPKTAAYSQRTSGETVIAIHFINYTFDKSGKMEKITVDDSEYVEKLFREMYDTWKEKKQGYRYKCCAMLYDLLYFCNQQEYEKRWSSYTLDSRIKIVANYIHGNFRNEQIEISHLAKMCSFSETYLRKVFKQHYGVSPKRYIIDLRLETAAQLLQSQLYSVAEVCERSGFLDAKYFAKLFKSRYGCSPKKYQSQRPEKSMK